MRRGHDAWLRMAQARRFGHSRRDESRLYYKNAQGVAPEAGWCRRPTALRAQTGMKMTPLGGEEPRGGVFLLLTLWYKKLFVYLDNIGFGSA